MARLLEGKVAIVTGAGGGIGREHALTFAREGAKVVVNDLGSDRHGGGKGAEMADKTVADIKAAGGEATANYDSVATREGADGLVWTALNKYGHVDVLVNNAGILRDKTLLNMSEQDFDLVLEVHLRGTFLCTQAVGRALKAQGKGGRIINTTSLSGLLGNFGQGNYAAAKGGIYSLTRTASMEFQRMGVTVNAIETAVAEEIVGALHAKLLPEQKSQLERKPTQNPGAYDLGQLDWVLEFAPDMLMAGVLKAAVDAAWKGETRPVEETLRKVRGKAGEAAIGAWLMFLLDLNPQEALAALDRKEEALRERNAPSRWCRSRGMRSPARSSPLTARAWKPVSARAMPPSRISRSCSPFRAPSRRRSCESTLIGRRCAGMRGSGSRAVNQTPPALSAPPKVTE